MKVGYCLTCKKRQDHRHFMDPEMFACIECGAETIWENNNHRFKFSWEEAMEAGPILQLGARH